MSVDKVGINLVASHPGSPEEAALFYSEYFVPLQALNPAIADQRAKLEKWIERDKFEARGTHDDSYDFNWCPLRILAEKAREKIEKYEEDLRKQA